MTKRWRSLRRKLWAYSRVYFWNCRACLVKAVTRWVARLVASGPGEGVFHAGDELVFETGPEGGVLVGDGIEGGGGAEQT